MCFLDSVIETEKARVNVCIEDALRNLRAWGYTGLEYPHGGICSPACKKYKHLSSTVALCDRTHPSDRFTLKDGKYCNWFTHMNRETKRFRQ